MKPIRWHLWCLVILFGAICFGGGFLAEHSGVFTPAQTSELTPEEWTAKSEAVRSELQKQLQTIGYVGGYEQAPKQSGVIRNDASRAFQALNLHTAGHALEAYLMDMDGAVLHTWWRESEKNASLASSDAQNWWRRAYIYPNGDLLAIQEDQNLAKLDKFSNVVWSVDGSYHHDLDVQDDGRIFVLTRKREFRPKLDRPHQSDDDLITVLNDDGKVVRKVSILDAFENSDYSALPLRSVSPVDVLHTNTIEVLDGRLESQSRAFKRGNVLVSCLYLDTIAVVDMERESVVWALAGMWRMQHQPTVLDNGNMLLFDNYGHHGHAKVIEFNPFTQQLVWSYKGKNNKGFPCSQLGSNQRLANGNTLITDSVHGRAFEVAADGEIVWEYVNPGRTGDDKELIAVLCEMVRLDPQFPIDWIPNIEERAE